MAVRLSLEEIILRALLHSAHCDLFIVQARQNSNGHGRGFAPQRRIVSSPQASGSKNPIRLRQIFVTSGCANAVDSRSNAIDLSSAVPDQRFSNQQSVVVISSTAKLT